MVSSITPDEAKRLIEEENALLIDIREPDEFAQEHIKGARLAPLSALPFLPPDHDTARKAIFYCRSGRRTKDHAAALEGRGFATTYTMEGGIEAWEKVGLPVAKQCTPLSMSRQIQIAAGGLVFLFSLLSLFIPAFIWLTLFVGAGLIFAGTTGICLMAHLLMRLPWNKKTSCRCDL
ncbi:MAG: rhodanese-like domain-containing protein [Alphaproteobacteria bacterium]|nr:rhodanese-like domain-containing protein [Alphaproteobacteria bacterium]